MTDQENPWWYPIRDEENGGFKVYWDHLGDAKEQFEELAEAYLRLKEQYDQMAVQPSWWETQPVPWDSPLGPAGPPLFPQQQIDRCERCGMEMQPVMGYVCNDINCPRFTRITCQ